MRYHPDCFISTERAHYGFIRSQPSPFLFLSGMCFLSSVLSTTLYKVRDRVHKATQEVSKAHSSTGRRLLPVWAPTKDVTLLCPTVRTSRLSLFPHVAFLCARYHSHRRRTARASKARQGKAAPMGSSPQGKMGTSRISPICTEYSASL